MIDEKRQLMGGAGPQLADARPDGSGVRGSVVRTVEHHPTRQVKTHVHECGVADRWVSLRYPADLTGEEAAELFELLDYARLRIERHLARQAEQEQPTKAPSQEDA